MGQSQAFELIVVAPKAQHAHKKTDREHSVDGSGFSPIRKRGFPV